MPMASAPGPGAGGGVSAYERTDMSVGEKAKARTEQVVGKAVRKVAHAVGNETTAAKGAALEARGKARGIKERSKDSFRR